MNHMVGALLDFTRSRLGGGIPIVRATMNMGKTVHDVVDEISAAHPTRTISIDARGTLHGDWDCARISQVVSNLISNALEHGTERTVVNVGVHGDDNEVTIAIHNRGPAIPEDQLDGIFNAMKGQSTAGKTSGPSANLGLGLYIADQIVHAHNGTLDVESSEERGTTFTVRLPAYHETMADPSHGTAAVRKEQTLAAINETETTSTKPPRVHRTIGLTEQRLRARNKQSWMTSTKGWSDFFGRFMR